MMWNNLFWCILGPLNHSKLHCCHCFCQFCHVLVYSWAPTAPLYVIQYKTTPSGHVGAWPHSFGTKMSSKFSFGTLIVYPKAFHLHLKWLKYSTKSRRYSHLRVSGSIFINAWLTLTGVKVLPQKHRFIEQIGMYWAQITFVRCVSCW